MLQNHPGETHFPVRPLGLLAAFEYLPRAQELGGRVLVAAAIVLVASGLVLFGILSDAPEPPAWGLPTVATFGGTAIVCLLGVYLLAHRAASAPAREQQTYYSLGNVPYPLDDEKRAALQLDGVNAERSWAETLEFWPSAARFERDAPVFRTFKLATREEMKLGLENDWRILSTMAYRSTVDQLRAGVHSRQFIETAFGPEGDAMLNRVANLTELPLATVETTLKAAGDRPAQLIWAWDLWRIIPLSRKAFMAGLITEEEAWREMLKASSAVHALFDDLHAYHENQRIGHAFWANNFAAAQARRKQLDAFEKNELQRPICELGWIKHPADTLHTLITPVSNADYVDAIDDSRLLH
ncbi:DUF1266 domain-containing protein [Thiosocius teredinicola]|uniref:DUF1266 domain-containing protein n=1 Tax=Thiosocius teredinicola TaxID=1973002 RepID=UPI000990D4DB